MTFAGTAGTITAQSATSVTVTSPAGAAGGATITIVDPSGDQNIGTFTYFTVPAVAGAPISETGPTGGGTSFTFTGTNLNTITSVTFAGTAGTITAQSATSVTVTSPAGAAGGATITIVDPSGDQNIGTFTYFTVPAVAGAPISETGPTGGGTSFTFTGTNLNTITSVTFAGTAGTITAQSATSVTVTSPAGAAGAATLAIVDPSGNQNIGTFVYSVIISPTE